jgi:hypothetical protein
MAAPLPETVQRGLPADDKLSQDRLPHTPWRVVYT